MVGVAVNVTAVPEQIVVAEAVMETSVVTLCVTLSVIVLLVTVVAVTHGALLVSSQLTASLSERAALLYVLLFVPTGFPFRYHW